MAAPLSPSQIARELADYQVTLTEPALEQLSCYLEFLLRWNQRMNLTGIRQPRAIVRQLFGESLFLAQVLDLRGWLVDIGSGAGFPGLALKLATPALQVTLIEARRKKCAFLREVVRECRFYGVDVVCERFEAWLVGLSGEIRPGIITTRAVGVDRRLLEGMGACVSPGGRVALLTSAALVESILQMGRRLRWDPPIPVPHSRDHVVLAATRV